MQNYGELLDQQLLKNNFLLLAFSTVGMVVKIDRYNRERAFRGFSKLRSSAWQCQGACILRSRELLRCRCEKGLGRGHALVAGVKSLHLGVLCSMVCQVLLRLNGRLPRPVNR